MIRKNGLQRDTRNLFVVKDKFTISMVVMVSQMHTYVKNHQIACFKYVLSKIHQFISIKLVKKSFQKRNDI